MERLVDILAPRSTADVIIKTFFFCLVLGLANYLRDRFLSPDGYDSYLNNLIEAAIVGLPFVVLALLMVRHLKSLQSKLFIIAHSDGLTGLPNRRAFVERLALAARERQGWLLMLDADHFKRINDQYGHAAGDACLRAIADLMTRHARQGDLLARLGGEEFAVHMSGASEAQATSRGDTLSRGVMVDLGEGASVPVTLSIGMVDTAGEADVTVLLNRADRALYRAKSEGRARALVYDPLIDDAGRERRQGPRAATG